VQRVEASQKAIVRLVEVARLGRLVDTGGVTRSAAARAGVSASKRRAVQAAIAHLGYLHDSAASA
jgi:DNA-binding LacI/PurR family transcriptional regulator